MWRRFAPLVKIFVAGGLIAWLVSSGKLDFKALAVLIHNPLPFVANLGYWLIGCVLLGSLRWWMLLRGLGVSVLWSGIARLHLIGLFFNTCMPGAVGGDLVKAVYVVRENKTRKTPIFLSILLDRIIGMFGLFCIGVGALTLAPGQPWENPKLLPAILFLTLVFCAILFFTLLALGAPDRWVTAFENRVRFPGANLIVRIVEAFRLYRSQPGRLATTLLISIIIQGMAMAYFWLLLTYLSQSLPQFSWFASVFPIGILVTAIPLAPGGLGLGHASFEQLLQLIGTQGGATIFNVFILSQLSLNLLGCIPYLFYRKQIMTVIEHSPDNDAAIPGKTFSSSSIH